MATEIDRARRLFTVDEYDRMGVAGVFGPEDRLELINGEIVEMSPIGPRHAACVASLTKVLVIKIGERGVVWAQNPVTVPRHSKPQPDVAVLRARSYRDGHPEPDDVFLLIEVAETSLAYDRGVKRDLYARAGIAEYWIVDTDAETVEVFRRPAAGGYGETRRMTRDDTIAPSAFPDVTIRVGDLFA
ncbi:MAG: Uma2 family endonuclease [Candidatus Rokubacteria bacterium]|nr:Uma2 family endonuclease [Candidatus Rokubacteria bacterium]